MAKQLEKPHQGSKLKVALLTLLGHEPVVPINVAYYLIAKEEGIGLVYVIGSKDSILKYYEKVLKALNAMGVADVRSRKISEVNISRNKGLIKSLLFRVVNEGYDKVYVDITGGRKPMSISAAMAVMEFLREGSIEGKAVQVEMVYLHLKDRRYRGEFLPYIPQSCYDLEII